MGKHGEAISQDLGLVAKLLRNATEDEVEAVIQNACNSSTQAQQLANAVGRVVATDGPLEDPSANASTKSFYRTMGSGRSFQTAFLGAVDETAWNTCLAGWAPQILFLENKK